jgi:hypothetical protein
MPWGGGWGWGNNWGTDVVVWGVPVYDGPRAPETRVLCSAGVPVPTPQPGYRVELVRIDGNVRSFGPGQLLPCEEILVTFAPGGGYTLTLPTSTLRVWAGTRLISERRPGEPFLPEDVRV